MELLAMPAGQQGPLGAPPAPQQTLGRDDRYPPPKYPPRFFPRVAAATPDTRGVKGCATKRDQNRPFDSLNVNWRGQLSARLLLGEHLHRANTLKLPVPPARIGHHRCCWQVFLGLPPEREHSRTPRRREMLSTPCCCIDVFN